MVVYRSAMSLVCPVKLIHVICVHACVRAS